MLEEVVLVDEKDRVLGFKEKMIAHAEGNLHRAFSIFVLNSQQQLLMQRRAPGKYHSGNLWSNTCCGHPRPHESISEAAHRRLGEEMGFECQLSQVTSLVYFVAVSNGLYEHEYNHILVGHFDGNPYPDSHEVNGWQWLAIDALRLETTTNPGIYTPWLATLVQQHLTTQLTLRTGR